jgi:hypothetical protein
MRLPFGITITRGATMESGAYTQGHYTEEHSQKLYVGDSYTLTFPDGGAIRFNWLDRDYFRLTVIPKDDLDSFLKELEG